MVDASPALPLTDLRRHADHPLVQMNIARAPAAGRNWEAAGADPYLAAEVSAESIIGIQSQGVIACAKHWLANEQEHFRNYANSQLDDRTSHEVYQLPFARSVQVGVASVMCSYNRVNGLWVGAKLVSW